MIMLRKVKFYKHLFLSANSVLCNVFYFTLIHNYYGDAMLRSLYAVVSSCWISVPVVCWLCRL